MGRLMSTRKRNFLPIVVLDSSSNQPKLDSPEADKRSSLFSLNDLSFGLLGSPSIERLMASTFMISK